MTTPTAAGAGMGAVTPAASPASKNTPQLHSIASSLRSCLDGMLPDHLRNDAAAFHQHLDMQKNRVQTEKNSWRFGLNYLFETLKQHKDWYARNQQYVQLKKDAKRFEAHLATVRGILSESVSKLDLEAGLRGAELEGRVGAYRVMFEVTKIISKLSRPLVKLQILKPNETSLSVYCDTFVLDIVLSGGEGDVESASLTTVNNEQSNQFPDRDDDLLQSLKLLAGGDSSSFTEKLIRLINRAELAVKFPDFNFEQLEEQLFTTVSEACAHQKCWTAARAVEGVTVRFKDPLYCVPVVEPPRKRGRVEESSGAGANVAAVSDDATDSEEVLGGGNDRGDAGDSTGASAAATKDTPRSTPLANGEWSGSISFIEWRGEVALLVAGYTPVVMAGLQARRLALAIMRKQSEDATDPGTASKETVEDEKLFNEFVSWTNPEGKKPISPHLHFTRDHSLCSVSPPRAQLAMRQEYSLTTKEISGGLRLASFPVPLSNLSTATMSSVLQICGHSLYFHSMLLSAFSTTNNLFGERIVADSDTAVNARIKVDVAAPDRITLNAGEVLGAGKQVLIEFTAKSDCSLSMTVKNLSGSPRTTEAPPHPELESAETIEKMVTTCHSIPLLTFFALKRPLLALRGQGATARAGVVASGEDCDGIAAVDDDLADTMKMEGEDMLLDEMNMF